MEDILDGLKKKDTELRVQALEKLVQVLATTEEFVPTRALDEVIIILPNLINTSLFSISVKAIECTPFILRQLIRQIRPLKPYLSNIIPCLIDRLGDSKEKSRELTLRAITDFWRLLATINTPSKDPNLSGISDPKALDTKSLDFLGRKIVELGLGHKTWRVREMTLFWLAECSRTINLFPLHKFTSAVLGLVEDVNESVREQAKVLIFEIYPITSEESRSSLSKSLQKSTLRKNTISLIHDTLSETSISKNLDTANLSSVSNNSIMQTLNQDVDIKSNSFWSANTSFIMESTPDKQDTATNGSHSPTSSLASSSMQKSTSSTAVSIPAPQTIPPMDIFDIEDLKIQLNQITSFFSGKETEDNWEFRDKSTYKVRQIVRANLTEEYITSLSEWFKSFEEDFIRTLISPRTTLSLSALHMLSDMALFLPHGFLDGSNLKLITALMKCGVSSRKLVADASQVATIVLIQHTSYNAKCLNSITSAIVDKNAQLRLYAVSYLHTFLIKHGPSKYKLMEKKGLITPIDLIQKAIQKSISDANPKVRELARSTFWVFESIWKERATNLFNTFDATNKKLVLNDKDVNPATVLTLNNQPHAPVPLSSSSSSTRNKINRPPSRVQSGSTGSARPTSAMSRNPQSYPKSTSRQTNRPGTVASNYMGTSRSDKSGPISASTAAALASRPKTSMRNSNSAITSPNVKMNRLPSSVNMRAAFTKSPLPGIQEASFHNRIPITSTQSSLKSNISARPGSRQGQSLASAHRAPSGLGKPISMIPSSSSTSQGRRPGSVLSSYSNGSNQQRKPAENTNGGYKTPADTPNASSYFSPPGPQAIKEVESFSVPSIATSPSLELADEMSMLKLYEPNTPKSDQQSLTLSPKSSNAGKGFPFEPSVREHSSLLGGFNLPLPETNSALSELQEKLNAKFPNHKARPSNAAIAGHRSRNRDSMSGFDAEIISMLPNQKDKLQILLRLSDKLNQGQEVTSSQFRTLNRMSKEMAYTVYPKWHEFWTLAKCFEKLLKASFSYLKNPEVESDSKSSCIYLIETLVSHQTPLANEFTIEIMSGLIDCRNLGDSEVGASAIDALITFAHAVDPILSFSTAMAYTKELFYSSETEKADDDAILTVNPSDPPSPVHICLGSGFLVLSKLIPRCSLDFIQLKQTELGEIVSNGFSYKSSEVRRYVLELVISIHSIIQPIGISLQGFFPNLSENKLRLVELYVK